MSCNCTQPTCDTCNPCCPPNPCAPCTVPPPPIPCQDECEIPIYTSEQCTYQPTSCVTWNGGDDACIGIINTNSLNTVLNSLITYTKNTLHRLTNSDGSLTIAQTNDACDDKAVISAHISTVAGNQLVLNNGLYVPAVNQVSNNDICTSLEAIFGAADDENQENGNPVVTYDFMAINTASEDACQAERISPPTSFAVTGNGRLSAFGKMEWYTTLTAANTAAVSGETVLLYDDTTENLTLKDGVNYFGIGNKKINNLLGGDTTNTLSNLIIAGTVAISNATVINNITNYNVTYLNNVSIGNKTKWTGGKFLDTTKSFEILEHCFIDQIYAERFITMNASYMDRSIIYNPASYNVAKLATLYINATTGDSSGDISGIGNSRIISPNNTAAHIQGFMAEGILTVVHNNFKSTIGEGVYLHMGHEGYNEKNIVAHNVFSSVSGIGMQVVANNDVSVNPNLLNWNVFSNIGFSESGPGISLVGASLKNCSGYSITGAGITVGGSEGDADGLTLSECIGDSKGGNGLVASRDIYVVGGTYSSRLDSASGNPIKIISPVLDRGGYFIIGAKTVAKSPLAYAIKADAAVNMRISGCQFVCRDQVTAALPTLGIDLTNITPTAVTIDAFGNIV